MAFDAFFPKITLPSKKTDVRKGGGLGIRVAGKFMVADAFQGGEATNGLIAWLKENNAEQIDLAVATHAHGDHTGGFYDIVEAGIPIKEFRCYHIDSIRGGNDESRKDSDKLLKLIRWLQIRGTRVLFVDHGDVIKFEDISWHIYRNQPARAAADDTYAWEYVNNGSLVLYSPELQGIIFGDGPENPKDAIAYFQKKFGKIEILIWFLISHHGNNFSLSNAEAAKDAGAKFAYESCVEADGPGTTSWTEFGARRVFQQNITVWMQNQNIYIHAAAGKITFTQGSRSLTFDIPYQGEALKEGWLKGSKGWWYRYASGSWPTGWAYLLKNGAKHWFYFDGDGWMQTGWKKLEWSGSEKKDKKDWFCFNKDGIMLTGFQKLGWSGGIDTFFFDENGVMLTGWQYLVRDGKLRWFYFDESGAMRKGWAYLEYNGEMYWYCFHAETGIMLTGWVDYKGGRCYLEPKSGSNQGHAYCSMRATIGGRTYSFDKNGYATEIRSSGSDNSERGLNGVDVASYQSGLNPAGMTTTHFVIVKFTQGTWYVNPYADKQYSAAKAAGKLLGAYHYGEGGDAKKEAQYFFKKLGTRIGECIPGIDWEGMQNPTFGSGEDVEWCLTFCDEFYRLSGVRPVVYMSKSVCWKYDWSKVAAKYQLWCAQYGSNAATDYRKDPWTDGNGWGAWEHDTIRQYSSHGSIKGYSGYIDINLAYLSKIDWQELAKPEKEKTVKDAVKPITTKWAVEVDQVTNPVKISNSGSDETGNYKGGKAGDQTGKEWRIRDWYNYPWSCVLRHPNAEVRKCLATLAVKAANNDNIGYDQSQRETYRKALEKAGWDPAKIEEAVESDCSAGVIANIIATGHILGIAGLQRFGATYTGNMRKEAGNRGFMILTDKKYLTSSEYLMAGDIPLNDQHHVCTVVTNGPKSGAEAPLTNRAAYELMPLIKKGSKGKAVKVLQVLLGGLTIDGDFGQLTHNSVLAFQKKKGLLQDGEVGPLTWHALLGTLPTLKQGSKGSMVKILQIMLGGLTIDGDFGQLTLTALLAFQKRHGLKQSGEVCQLTWTALIESEL